MREKPPCSYCNLVHYVPPAEHEPMRMYSFFPRHVKRHREGVTSD